MGSEDEESDTIQRYPLRATRNNNALPAIREWVVLQGELGACMRAYLTVVDHFRVESRGKEQKNSNLSLLLVH